MFLLQPLPSAGEYWHILISTGARAQHELFVVELTYLTAERQHSFRPRSPQRLLVSLYPQDNTTPLLSLSISLAAGVAVLGWSCHAASASPGAQVTPPHPFRTNSWLLLTSFDQCFVTIINTRRKQSRGSPQSLETGSSPCDSSASGPQDASSVCRMAAKFCSGSFPAQLPLSSCSL